MLPKTNRLRSQLNFQRVYEEKRSVANKIFIVYYKENDFSDTCFGISISKKVLRRAHERNLLRRRLHVLLRERLLTYKKGYDVIIIARKGVEVLSYQEIGKNLDHIIRKCGLVDESIF